MSKELKARIDDVKTVEQRLEKLGAEFVGESMYKYVYFRQPVGEVLKLTTANGKTHKVIIKAQGNKFEIIANDPVDNPDTVAQELSKLHGVKRELRNVRKFFELNNDTVSINQIEGVGNFLIIESEEPSVETLEKLGISKNAVVTDSFDNL